MNIQSPSLETDILKSIENGNNILSVIGMKMIKQQQSMDEQLINMLIVNQPQQVTPKSDSSTFEYIA
jgi:hypothetical protein